jgi:hypothetical protein
MISVVYQLFILPQETRRLPEYDGELTTEDDVGEGRCLEHNVSSVGRI